MIQFFLFLEGNFPSDTILRANCRPKLRVLQFLIGSKYANYGHVDSVFEKYVKFCVSKVVYQVLIPSRQVNAIY